MNRQDGIHMDALAAALAETGDTALDIVRGTGIPLPKVLRLLGLSTASRAAPALDGLEIVQLCLYAELTLSAVIEDLAALPRFLTVKETCAFLGVSASTVKRFVKSGDLRQWTPERGHRKITRDSVAKLVGVDPVCIPNRRKSTE